MKRLFLFCVSFFAVLNLTAQSKDVQLATDLITRNSASLGLSTEDLKEVIVKDSYFNKFAGTQMVYLQQSYKGLPVFNQMQVIAFKDGKVVSNAGGRNRKIKSIARENNTPDFSAIDAIKTALEEKKISYRGPFLPNAINGFRKFDFGDLDIANETVTAELMWVPLHDGQEVHLAWQVRLVPKTSADYFMIRVSAETNKVIDENNLTVYCNFGGDGKHQHNDQCPENNSLSIPEENKNLLSPNLVGTVNYLVVPYPAESPKHTGGTPAVVTNPWTLAGGNATSLGWHNDGISNFEISRGNNVYVQEDRDQTNSTFGGSATSSTSPDPLNFNSPPDFTQAPTVNNNQQFSLANIFYWNNLIHDLSYVHGFDEPAGNFQRDNQGRGGLGSDYVLADCQDAGGLNNANFSTPDDGSRPRMQMYLWSGTPQKDGSLDNGIVTHEFTHGISQRLTGGPSNSSCLTSAEQMGEGWSDYFSIMITQNWATSTLTTGFNSPRSIGTYSSGQSPSGSGIRNQKYCTNMAVNNLVFSNDLPSGQHDRGEIWCVTLWDMTWNIINQNGTINPNIFNPAAGGGNSIALKLVLEGMKLQPCDPGFIDGRNAILKADSILYGGQYSCAIREAFRRRGMGALASQGSADNLTDQVDDYSGGVSLTLTQGGVTSVTEGQNIVYTQTVSTACDPLSNYILRDTLPPNVTWVSGGSYDNVTRIVSFTVNQAAGTTQTYQFVVNVNMGSWFATTNLINEAVPGPALPTGWTTSATPPTRIWRISTVQSHSPSSSLFCPNVDESAEEILETPTLTLPANTTPRLSFWHRYSTEGGWDGGVVELTKNAGGLWFDLGPNMTSNGYNSAIGSTGASVLTGQPAFSGNSNGFIKTWVDLGMYAGQTVNLRFRFGSDDNTVGDSPAGWFVDDILLEVAPIVRIRSALFNAANLKLLTKDTFTYILQAPSCTNAAISVQPEDVNACSGTNTNICVTATGTTISYQWQLSTDGINFNDISGANSNCLPLSSITTGMDDNIYRVRISNSCPSSVTSGPAILKVSDPASITSQPVNQLICAGDNATFTAAATGGANGFQWQVSTDGTNFADIAGETSSTLSLTNVNSTLNGNKYRLMVTSCNDLISSSATLTVMTAPEITAQPQTATACSGNDHTFSVTATGTGLSYQWQVSTDGINFNDISGAVTSTFTLTSVSGSVDGNQYRVVVTGTCPTPVTSLPAILTVGTALNITAQPANASICGGFNTSFSITATGVVSYQWQVSTDGVNFSDISGATNATLDLSNVSVSMNGNKYRVLLVACGPNTTSSVATLTVTPPAEITAQPENTSICVGSNGNITVTATGTVSYQWQVSTDGVTFNDISGATSASLPLNAATLAMDGNLYRVVLTPVAPCNPVTSDEVELSINTLPIVGTTVVPDDEVCAGESITLNGTGASTYTWNNGASNGVAFVPGGTNTYTVTGTDANGCINTSSLLITVNTLPSIQISASPTTNLLPGMNTLLTAVSTPPSTTFSWFKNNVLVPGVTTDTLRVHYNELGDYSAMVTDGLGCSKMSNLLTIADSVETTAFIFPNPNRGIFVIRHPVQSIEPVIRKVTVFDSKGSRVFSNAYTVSKQSDRIDMSLRKLSSGVYFVELSDSNGSRIKTGKLLIL